MQVFKRIYRPEELPKSIFLEPRHRKDLYATQLGLRDESLDFVQRLVSTIPDMDLTTEVLKRYTRQLLGDNFDESSFEPVQGDSILPK